MARIRRSGNGRRKIEIKKIESEHARLACFSKRKPGIFSKANELVTQSGAKVALLIQSPTGCPYTFGSPSFNHVMDKFLDGGPGVNETEAYEEAQFLRIQELNRKVMEATTKYDEAIERRKLLVKWIEELSAKNEDVRRVENADHLNTDELRKMVKSLEVFRKAIIAKIVNDIKAKSGNPSLTNLDNHGSGTGQWNDKSTKSENPNNKGPSHVKAFDLNLNLCEDGSPGHFGEPSNIISPFTNPNATNVGPSEPPHITLPKTVLHRDLVELDLLGGHANFAAENETKSA